MEENTYVVPIRDIRAHSKNIIFFVRINLKGEILEYMAKNIREFRSVSDAELRMQVAGYLNNVDIA